MPPPLALYVAGQNSCIRAGLAIVGTRQPTAVGARDAYDYAHRLASLGLPIVSGLAVGIDAAAHTGALAAGQASGSTIAVLGTGLARCYPAQHAGLAERIQAQGALVSELPLDAGPRRGHFPRRNRIVAGLVRGVLIIEASAQSGSLITARLAADAGRDVFAMPGSIHSPVAQGCNALIRDGAKLVARLTDIIDEYPDMHQAAKPPCQRVDRTAGPGASDQALADQTGHPTGLLAPAEAAAVWHAMGYTATDMDILIHHTQMTVEEVAYQLTLLELSGWAVRLADGRYMRSMPAK
jgi:DNA processing protein